MILQRNNTLLISFFLLGLLASLFGGFKVGPANFHAYLAFISTILIVLIYVSSNRTSIKIWYIPIAFTILISIPRFNGQIGFLQIIYTLCPFLCFLLGTTVKKKNEFTENLIRLSNRILMVLVFCCIFYLLTGLTDLDSRASTIFIALILLINLILPSSRKIKLITIVLSIFILLVGARGALFSFLISYLFSTILSKFKLRYSLTLMFLFIFVLAFFNKIILDIIFSNSYLRDRTFYDGVYSYDKLIAFDFNTSGRDLAWPVYWDHILGRSNDLLLFLFGDGPGSASTYGLEMLGSSWAHPHNEFIRILFDYGTFGLFSFLLFWINIIYTVIRWGGEFEKKICLALAFFTILIMSTDNPLMYPLYYGNLSLFLLGFSYSSSYQRKFSEYRKFPLI
ncbi:O-antigen ligase family protein [Acinetobacter soli]|uniref:O-antigen ligase family protein n=1 Tax=Acinetobacter soli TaxID=487316 RepID=UPI001ABD41AF|nr:O-antigen ligase family protein [Acinetobacter soli]MBO3672641.1 O-antigen ligase family protein [Acinetobacter soli]